MADPIHTLKVGKDTFYLYERETLAEIFGPYEPFVQLWQTKRAGKQLPSWKDFTFEELYPWVGKMLLVDLDAGDIMDGTYRLCGGDWVRISNKELTGKRYTEVIHDEMRATMDPYHRVLHKEGLIGRRTTTSYLEGRDFFLIDMLDVVLSDNGNTATQYLGLAIIKNIDAPSQSY